MDIKTEVGHRIKELRKQCNITQEDLAHKTDLDRTYINSIENGRRNVSIVNLEKIAKGLKVKLSTFFDTNNFK